ncbi:TetR/AcrR family transcriptional regulator [Vibrio algarum]|uniref:TetR/AcrR family transcriptional regulator n=1 Tax=Vibrio algarum TaxID=3020714 RepID=A0ABT4YYI6_9VIBR|nr:TetR/AcrR family transcriptional regulator [Vibrio sp. KJ40-1]MDB1126216.1 TetR/AcrR family transcriptional regulator [Vibrio sp. KJ40-1]
MGRSSAAKAELTKQKIIESAFALTLNEGFEALTFTKLSNHCGVSRSGINRHFPKKNDIVKVLEPKLEKLLKAQMDFSSPSAFYKSWVDGLASNSEFRSALLAAGPIIPTDKGIRNLKRLIKGSEAEVIKTIYMCIGYAVVNLN